jgi:hydrogenase maturation protease
VSSCHHSFGRRATEPGLVGIILIISGIMKDFLILGFGSTVLSDEAVVPMILDEIRNLEWPNVEIRNELTLSLDQISILENYRYLFIFDTFKSTSEEVGAIKICSTDDYQPTLHLENSHDISLPEMIDLASLLGHKLPDKIRIVAINIADNMTIDNKVTKPLKLLYRKLLVKVICILHAEFSYFSDKFYGDFKLMSKEIL